LKFILKKRLRAFQRVQQLVEDFKQNDIEAENLKPEKPEK